MTWSVYMVRCSDGSLYTGISADVERRFEEHAAGGRKSAKYLRGRGPLKLIFKKLVGTRSEALVEERRVKRLTKAQKEALVRVVPRS